MYAQENKFICSNFSRIYCLVFFSYVLGIDQINEVKSQGPVPFLYCDLYKRAHSETT